MSSNDFRSLFRLQFFSDFHELGTRDLCVSTQKTAEQIFKNFDFKIFGKFFNLDLFCGTAAVTVGANPPVPLLSLRAYVVQWQNVCL